MVQTKHAILILCHCIPTKHTPLSATDNPFLPSDWKQIAFGYMAICHREDKIEHKLNIYLSRDILLRYVQLGYVYSRGKKLKFEKSSLWQAFPPVNSDLQRSQWTDASVAGTSDLCSWFSFLKYYFLFWHKYSWGNYKIDSGGTDCRLVRTSL